MINTTSAAPLFWYIYRPSRKRANGGDGGFNVALYPDSTLVYCRYDQADQLLEQSAFQLPADVTENYLTILHSQSWWMSDVPLNVRVTNRKPQYSSMFGFAGHPLFICDEIDTLVLAPFNSQRGMYARRLRMMLECIAEMLYAYGIGLTVNSFVWNWQMIKPFTPMQQNAQMVSPTAAQMPAAETAEDIFDVAQ